MVIGLQKNPANLTLQIMAADLSFYWVNVFCTHTFPIFHWAFFHFCTLPASDSAVQTRGGQGTILCLITQYLITCMTHGIPGVAL